MAGLTEMLPGGERAGRTADRRAARVGCCGRLADAPADRSVDRERPRPAITRSGGPKRASRSRRSTRSSMAAAIRSSGSSARCSRSGPTCSATGTTSCARCCKYRLEDEEWREAPFALLRQRPLGRRASGSIAVGRWRYTIEAWTDHFASWRDEVEKKRDAGQNIELELVEGRAIVEAALHAGRRRDADAACAPCCAISQPPTRPRRSRVAAVRRTARR